MPDTERTNRKEKAHQPTYSVELQPSIYDESRSPNLGTDVGLCAALASLQANWNTTVGARQDIYGDETLTETARIFKLGELYAAKVDKKAEEARAALTKASEGEQEFWACITSDMKPSDKPGDIALASEARAVLRSMPSKDRRSAINAAIAYGDMATVIAVTTGPEWITGISPEEAQAFRQRAALATIPNGEQTLEEVRRRARFASQGLRNLDRLRDNFFTTAERNTIARAQAMKAKTASHFGNNSD